MKKLIIVESPAKSKTIEKYLGKDFEVVSSLGHIRDLTTSGYGGYGVDIENNFSPKYKIISGKKTTITSLTKAVKKVDYVYLASDPDREGEAIAWHLKDTLKLEESKYSRIVFNEITKNKVIKALEEGRDLDMHLVNSQETRRILDRIIGFSLSKLLQRKIGSKSAGRVQSVALKLIIDKENEIIDFISEEYWLIGIEYTKNNKKLTAKLTKYNNEKIEFKSIDDVNAVNLSDDYKVVDIVLKNRTKNSPKPFTTSTLTQSAYNKLYFNSKKTMFIAQKLYEGVDLEGERTGIITYMRTDSLRISDDFIYSSKKYIEEKFGENYFKPYYFKNRENSQDAHEAIRPTNINLTPELVSKYLSVDELKLYTLIYNQALATLMANTLVEDTTIIIDNNNYQFETTGTKILFDGYIKVLKNQDDEGELPEFIINEILKNVSLKKDQKFTQPPARYNDASLIKKMEEAGIGRPSTYAVILETLKARGYVLVEKRNFVPTEQGKLTIVNLDQYFQSIININYTAKMEESLDEIAEGVNKGYVILKDFYEKYVPLLSEASENMEKIYPMFLEETCPQCNKQLVKRNGRYGPFVACSGFPTCRYIKTEKVEVVDTGISCPKCSIGKIIEKVAKKGRVKGKKFYACDNYPKCKSIFKQLDEIK